ncbi:MAG: fibrinogen-like YCDxxxxGGGW domain-containing protein [bacterium]|nr:fibrinogen-like YCDxxxxGGGW domain-containing protein [bacterium]
MSNYSAVKKIIVLTLMAAGFLFSPSVFSSSSPDAIATRVIPNPDHLSPMRWYQDNVKNQGSPQQLLVDGYEAVRDGRTVYVNAANLDLDKNKFYTNIYLLSYSQGQEQATEDIFGQLLKHWKFNINLSAGKTISGGIARCSKDNSSPKLICQTDSDCAGKGYCNSAKAQVVRDTHRMSRLNEVDELIEQYKNKNGFYPVLAAGSYVANAAMSVWPSWQETLGAALGKNLPLDPINDLKPCGGYNEITCWNEADKRFAYADQIDNEKLSDNNFVYLYKSKNDGLAYRLCAYSEIGLIDPDKRCNAGCIPVNYDCAAATCAGQTCDTGCGIDDGVKEDTVWTPNVDPATVCTTDKVTETSNCNNTRNTLPGTKCCDSTWTPNVDPATVCTTQTIIETSNCNNTRNTLPGTKTDGACCIPTAPDCADATCAGQTCDTGCGIVNGAKTDGVCAPPPQNCPAKLDNTDWNISSTYTQTWTLSGTSWTLQPVSYNTSYSETVGICKYKCQANFKWTGSACINYASCLELKNSGVTANGVYTIDPDGGGPIVPYSAYCNMATDGGGWTLIMKAVDDKFIYSDPLWENNVLLNENNFNFTSVGRSKYPAFNNLPFTEIMTSDINDFGKYYKYKTGPKNNAIQLFLGPGVEISSGSLSDYFNLRAPADGRHWAQCGTFEPTVLNIGLNQKKYLTNYDAYGGGGKYCDWGGGARFGQRVNGYHSGSGNMAGQGWGTWNQIDDVSNTSYYNFNISQLLWVR